jgi:palmitoyl-protein thioesterase
MRRLITLTAVIAAATASILASESHPPISHLPRSPKPLPLIIWHGLGDNYKGEGLVAVGELAQEVNPGTFVYNIRLDEDPSSDRTATFFGDVNKQLEQVCSDLANHPILSTAPAVNAMGFSQGGQFLRGYVERCNNPPVRNLITFGSQHNGITEFQNCGATDWLCKGAMALLRSNTWSTYVQTHLVPAQYYRSTNSTTQKPSDEYLEYSNFLADINNEREDKNETYAANMAKLRKFVMYVFEDDTTVIPKESGWFAQVTNLTTGDYIPLRNRTLYSEDWIGLRKLDQKGGIEFKSTEGQHMHLSDKLLKQVFKEYFAPEKKEDEEGESWTSTVAPQEVMEL